MRKLVIACVILLALGLAAPPAQAGPIGLFEGLFYQDGSTDALSAAPASWDLSGFDWATGLGTITATAAGLGVHSFGVFLDIELDEDVNGFSNEYGTVSGSAPAGLAWEIDEPGFFCLDPNNAADPRCSTPKYGDIYSNFVLGALDGTNAVPVGSPDDVSFALGWAFILAADETATLTWVVSETAPAGGFYLVQTDPNSLSPTAPYIPLSVYFSSGLTVGGGGTTVPDAGGTLLLLGLGLAACSRLRRRG